MAIAVEGAQAVSKKKEMKIWLSHSCSRLFERDPYYTRQNALYSIDPIQTREWARRITKGLLNPFVNRFSEA